MKLKYNGLIKVGEIIGIRIGGEEYVGKIVGADFYNQTITIEINWVKELVKATK